MRPKESAMADPGHGKGGTHSLCVAVLLSKFRDVVVALAK